MNIFVVDDADYVDESPQPYSGGLHCSKRRVKIVIEPTEAKHMDTFF